MPKPNFFIIGAVKGGTTSLYVYLKQHPQVFMTSRKEPNFFLHDVANPSPEVPIQSWKEYAALFKEVTNESVIGEASPGYLASSTAYGRIAAYAPDSKLLSVLRNPCDRAYSHFLMKYRSQLVDMRETEVLDYFLTMFQEDRSLMLHGFYFESLQRYLSVFDRSQMEIFLFEDLKNNLDEMMKQIFRFLDVETMFQISTATYNKGGIPKNKTQYALMNTLRYSFNKTLKPFMPEKVIEPIYDLYNTVKNRNLSVPPNLSFECRKILIDNYREDILRLQDLLQRDLSQWSELS